MAFKQMPLIIFFLQKTNLRSFMCQGIVKSSGTKKQCTRTQEPYCWQHDPVQIQLRKERRKTKSKEGFIYIYRHEDEEKSYYKIGHTTRDLKKRMKEWEQTDGKHKIKIVMAFYVDNSNRVERKIHKLLDMYRVYRYYIEEEKTYCTVHKSNGQPVFPSDKNLKKKYRLEGAKKRVEWVLADFREDILPVVEKEILNL